jgi:hypothetical protein
MQSDPRYMRIRSRLRELEAELTAAGYKGQISKITDVQREIDDLYRELGPQPIRTSGAMGSAFKDPTALRLKVKAQNVGGRIFRPRPPKVKKNV